MNEPDILYPAIFVFSMLLIGLLLTMWEFSRLQKRKQRDLDKQGHPSNREFHASRDNVPNASSL
jgi:hypothetical protein